MESGASRMRFGRCPYCRAMIYQDPEAAIYYCSKCRTPIRGKNPEPTEEMDHALSRLEILSADTAAVFSDDLDACPEQVSVLNQPPLFSNNPKPCSNSTANRRDNARSYSNGQEQDERRPLSRRTRRPACSDSIVLRYGVFTSTHLEAAEEGFSPPPRNACGRRRQRSLAGLQELETSIGCWSSRPAPPRVAPSPLVDPAFHRDLLRSLDSLRSLIAAIEPASTGGATAAAARRPLLPPAGVAHLAGASRRGPRARPAHGVVVGIGVRRRKHHHCLPVFGGTPFVVCRGCYELLQVPATTTLLSRRKVARFRCGGCEEVLQLRAPAVVAGSGPYRTTWTASAMSESDDAGTAAAAAAPRVGIQFTELASAEPALLTDLDLYIKADVLVSSNAAAAASLLSPPTCRRPLSGKERSAAAEHLISPCAPLTTGDSSNLLSALTFSVLNPLFLIRYPSVPALCNRRVITRRNTAALELFPTTKKSQDLMLAG
ncbi:hypothetical protein HU200_024180 [Digitaria exilis]|uniref:Probable zinc-ribbon domain-containing protein n=1 Tax=Digitaria exilis TaxID=1010633 RepID=A0A835ETC0_9POAL|nr:hypothetical protein HU200_024180 [Digitaria exilis]